MNNKILSFCRNCGSYKGKKKMGSILLTSIMFFSLLACGQSGSSTTWQEQYDLGIRYLSEGSYEEAIIAFTAAIEIDPKQPTAYVGRGDAYIGSGETDEILAMALVDYKQAIELDNTIAEPYRKVAEIYVLMGYTQPAISILRCGVEATGNANLQESLKELLSVPLTVLTYVALYNADGELENHDSYTYDAQGYMTKWETISDKYGKTKIETWTFDSTLGRWIYTIVQNDFDTPGGYETGRQYEERWPGTHDYHGGGHCSTGGYAMNPLFTEENYKKVIGNGGVLYPETTDDYYDYAIYTFDEGGLPIKITSYVDGNITATVILEWAVIVPTGL